jgi:hypothetical protein
MPHIPYKYQFHKSQKKKEEKIVREENQNQRKKRGKRKRKRHLYIVRHNGLTYEPKPLTFPCFNREQPPPLPYHCSQLHCFSITPGLTQ